MLMNKRGGFTLIELLVVISIIGLLSAVVLASLNSARQKANDSRRALDMKQLATAINMYYSDNGSYPTPGGGYSTCAYGVGDTGWVGPAFINSLVPKYISSLPQDPNHAKADCTGPNFRNYYFYSNIGTGSAWGCDNASTAVLLNWGDLSSKPIIKECFDYGWSMSSILFVR